MTENKIDKYLNVSKQLKEKMKYYHKFQLFINISKE